MLNKDMFLSNHKKTRDQLTDEVLFSSKTNPFISDNELLQLYFRYKVGLNLLKHKYTDKTLLKHELLDIISKILTLVENSYDEIIKLHPKENIDMPIPNKEDLIKQIKQAQELLINYEQ